jgi:hypothetical protein
MEEELPVSLRFGNHPCTGMANIDLPILPRCRNSRPEHRAAFVDWYNILT